MMPSLRRFDASVGVMLEDGGRIMFLIFSAMAVLIFLFYQVDAVRHRYSLDYGEAPLVDQAMRLASGQSIYHADLTTPPYTVSNYPPIYVSLVALAVKVTGPAQAFIAGRMISVLSAWTSAVLLMLIVYAPTRDRFAALSAGLLFLAFPFVVSWSPLLRIDMLALALSLGGLALLVWGPPTPGRLIGVALLLVAAVYTRQSYGLAAPLAAFVWLVVRDRRRALMLAGLVAGIGLLLFLILNITTDGGFFFNIVAANVNEFQTDQLKYYAGRLHKAALLPLIFGCASLFLHPRRNPLWPLAAPYLFGAALSAATIGKVGSNVNYLLELCAALGLAAGGVIAWSSTHLPIHSLRAGIVILLALGVGRLMHVMLEEYTSDLHERLAARAALGELEALVAGTTGPVLADEYMGMLTLQGRPLVIQPFEVTQLALAGKWDQTPLVEGIENREFDSIILYDRAWSRGRWTEEMLAAIESSYVLVDVVAENRVYMPSRSQASSTPEICPGAPWRLPSDAFRGVEWRAGGLDFFGHGSEGRIPVYAVADGLLSRPSGWTDAVAILHEDPLHPGRKVWTYYGSMAAPNGTDSYVDESFPEGASGIPVEAGQLLGYQGSWSGRPGWPRWVHLHFAVLPAGEADAPPKDISTESRLDPMLYLHLAIMPAAANDHSQPLRCGQP